MVLVSACLEVVLTHSAALQLLVDTVALQEIGVSKRKDKWVETAAYLTMMHLCTLLFLLVPNCCSLSCRCHGRGGSCGGWRS